jgi:hypothetical protein
MLLQRHRASWLLSRNTAVDDSVVSLLASWVVPPLVGGPEEEIDRKRQLLY